MMMNRIKVQGASCKAKSSRFFLAPFSLSVASPVSRGSQRGFTLVEMIMVIVITGIIGGIVAVFLYKPIQGYIDVGRRADMTDIADTALRRIARDLRLALPNSVRVTGTCNGSATCFIEFLPTTGGGRYRAALAASAPYGNMLDFTNAADNSFDVLGPSVAANAGDYLVIYNLGIASATPCSVAGADVYQGCNRRPIVSGGSSFFFTTTAYPFPFDSPSHRFQVVTTPVTYVCDPVGGTLTRYWGYAIQTNQPTALGTLSSVNPGALLAKNVSGCSFSYNPNVVAQRSGLVTMNLGITESGETVTLYSATHVSNVP
jgi:MSHA biogenesis protein MshO